MRLIAYPLALLLGLTAHAFAQSSAGSGVSGGGGGGSGSTTITGTLPAFAQTPTFNVGTIAGIATETGVQQVRTALGSPFQAGGSIGNTAFGISGTLPAFAATPTFNLGTLNGAATAANQATEIAAINNRSVSYFEFTGATAASQSIAGTSRDSGAPPSPYTRFAYFVSTSQAGTAYIQGSPDGSSFFQISSQAVAAGSQAVLTTPLVMRYMRGAFTNGATAGTATTSAALLAN